MDGELVASGERTQPVPLRVAGLVFGSAWTGQASAEADLEEVCVLGRPLSGVAVAFHHGVYQRQAALGPMCEEEERSRLESAGLLMLQAQGDPAGAALMTPLSSELRLSIAPSGPDGLVLTLHNAIPGVTYQILSREDLSTGNWQPETTIEAVCCQNQIPIARGGRSVLFFRARQLEVPPEVGLQPNRIQTENAITGDSDWWLVNPATAGWPADGDATTPEIEGYASATSVNIGETLQLYVDVRNNDPQFTIEFYRMGWYGGLGARKMGESRLLTSEKQNVPTMQPDGLIDCAWNSSSSLAIPLEWVSGVYLAKLTTVPTGKQSYIIFVVREDCRCSDFLFQCSVTTYQAYNPWGGNSLYDYPYVKNCDNELMCPQCQPPRQYAQRVSFNRPYAAPTCNDKFPYASGTGEFMATINVEDLPAWEYNLLRWMERQGYDVTYCTSIDTHRPWPATKQIKTFLSVGHDEYWSEPMRTHVSHARDSGVNLAFFSANTCWGKIAFEPGERVFGRTGTGLWREFHANSSSEYPAEIELLGVEFVFNSLYNANMTIANTLPDGSGEGGKH